MSKTEFGSRSRLLGGVSGLALAMLAAVPQPAAAQDANTETVVVVGLRQSLTTAQQIKQNADTIVDSISATDIGAMPDKSVAEALQRVPGITVSRFAATTDTSHFSAEPSNVLIRGLTQVRSEFNGRDSFNANSSRGLSWADVAPELMAGVDTYKNQTADMIEGGIAGTINLRTRVPFDAAERMFAVGADLNYGTIGDRVTPDFSALYSDRFKTSHAGEFGILANIAYSKVYTGTEGEQISRVFQFSNPALGSSPVFVPAGGDIRNSRYNRGRLGGSAAAQWQNDSGTLLATAQFNYSEYDNSLKEYAVMILAPGQDMMTAQIPATGPQLPPSGDNNWILPPTGTSYIYDSRGFFQDGILEGENGWNGLADAGAGLRTYPDGTTKQFICQPWAATDCAHGNLARLGTALSNETRYSDNKEFTWDAAFNLKYDPSEKLHLNFDMQYIRSGVNNYDITANLKTFHDLELDLRSGHPVWKLAAEGTDAMNLMPGGITNMANYFPEYVMDHKEHSKGYEIASRFDGSYDFGSTWLNSVKFGARFADRLQTVNWSTYNWQGFRPTWTWVPSGTPWYASDFQSSYFQTYNYGKDFMYGNVFPAVDLPFVKMDTIVDESKIRKLAANTQNGGLGNWVPVCERAGLAAGNCYTPAEIVNVRETTWAGYAVVKFGGPDATIFNEWATVSGNLGVRFVDTVVTSSGGVTFPRAFDDPSGSFSGSGIDPLSLLTAEQRGFANNASYLQSNKAHYTHVLPSLTIKFNLPQDWVVRFAASRALSRPDMGYLRNYVTMGASYPSTVVYHAGDTVPVTYSADAGNPNLKPATADQFDISFERYFAAVGSFSIDVFFKQFHNYIQYGNFSRTFTNPVSNVTQTVTLRGPVNGNGGSVKGFEVAYTRYMDFLPGAWKGLGVQANLTVLKNSGITSPALAAASGTGTVGAATMGTFTGLPLEGMSDIQANLVGLYELDPWAFRLAYNLRSKYMVSAADCCIRTDIFQKAYGQLDGSLRYRIGDHWEASVQASNILNATTTLEQQVNGAPRILVPRSWFMNDRRLMLGVRAKY